MSRLPVAGRNETARFAGEECWEKREEKKKRKRERKKALEELDPRSCTHGRDFTTALGRERERDG